MDSPQYPTKSSRLPCTRLSRSKKSSTKPVIRVVQIHNPVYVHTDAISFPSLVQKLTGINTCLPVSLQSEAQYSPSCSHACSSADFYQPHAGAHLHEACWWSGGADGVFPDWGSTQQSSHDYSSKSCSGYHNYGSFDAEISLLNDNSRSSSSEGYGYENPFFDREGYGPAFPYMCLGAGDRFSELDVRAALASDHALPDITMLPPLVL